MLLIICFVIKKYKQCQKNYWVGYILVSYLNFILFHVKPIKIQDLLLILVQNSIFLSFFFFLKGPFYALIVQFQVIPGFQDFENPVYMVLK